MKSKDYWSWMGAQLCTFALQFSFARFGNDRHIWMLYAIHCSVAGLWTLAHVGLKRRW